MKLVFNEEGILLGTGTETHNQYKNDENKFFGESISGIKEVWRYSYDVEKKEVVCAYPTLSDEEALEQLVKDQAAEENAE